MKVKVLGCSGGIGGKLRTTALLVHNNILIDAGTGVGDLSIAELSLIDHVFITHAHLDHIAMLPMMLDTVGAMRARPLVVHATAATVAMLQEHIFNWKIWPDFSAIPNTDAPFMRFEVMEVGDRFEFGKHAAITALPAVHTVPAVGYQVDSGQGSLVFTGDTTSNDDFWPVVNAIPNLRYLIIETAFCNREQGLAVLSKHLCPTMLADELCKLTSQPEIYITHLKPGEIELTMAEIDEYAGQFSPKMLQNGTVLVL
jgi:cAMP phosphodiesterase